MQEKKTKLKIEFWGMKVSNFVQIGGDRTGGAPKPRKSQVHNRETSGAPHESWLCLVTLLTSLSLSLSLVSTGSFWQGRVTCVRFFFFPFIIAQKNNKRADVVRLLAFIVL
jgi:hypothetical protein